MQTILVLRGGVDAHEISLKTGGVFFAALSREPYRPLDIFIDRQGAWHLRGLPITPERALGIADIAAVALHGEYGEDGTLQKILERSGIPFTGSSSFGAKLAMQKPLAKEMMKRTGVSVPAHVMLSVSPDLEKEALEAFRMFAPPIVVKPTSSGSSRGVILVHTFQEFWEAVKKAFSFAPQVMAEEFIVGRQATAGVIDDFREVHRYPLIPVEVALPTPYTIVDARMKQEASVPLRAPGYFTKGESLELERLSVLAHDTLGLRHYSRSDFVVSPRGVYFLEANALPALGGGTAFSESLKVAGVSDNAFTEHLISLVVS